MNRCKLLAPFVPATLLFVSACGPAPADLCRHIDELARAESKAGSTQLSAEQCEAALEKRREQLGSAAWAKKANCMLEAASLAALDAC